MATTSLWHIKGRLKDLIDYVENPEKTISKDKYLQDFYNVFSYGQYILGKPANGLGNRAIYQPTAS